MRLQLSERDKQLSSLQGARRNTDSCSSQTESFQQLIESAVAESSRLLQQQLQPQAAVDDSETGVRVHAHVQTEAEVGVPGSAEKEGLMQRILVLENDVLISRSNETQMQALAERFRTEWKEMDAENRSLREQIDRSQSDLMSIQTQLEEMKSFQEQQEMEWQEEVHRVEEEAKHRLSQLEKEHESVLSMCDALTQQLASRERDVSEKAARIESLEDAVEESKDKEAKALSNLVKWQTTSKQKDDRATTLGAKLARLEKDHEALQRRATFAEAMIQREKDNVTKERDVVMRERETMQREKDQRIAETARMEIALQSGRDEIERLEEDLRRKMQEVAAASSKAYDLEEMIRQHVLLVEAVQRENEQLRLRIQEQTIRPQSVARWAQTEDSSEYFRMNSRDKGTQVLRAPMLDQGVDAMAMPPRKVVIRYIPQQQNANANATVSAGASAGEDHPKDEAKDEGVEDELHRVLQKKNALFRDLQRARADVGERDLRIQSLEAQIQSLRTKVVDSEQTIAVREIEKKRILKEREDLSAQWKAEREVLMSRVSYEERYRALAEEKIELFETEFEERLQKLRDAATQEPEVSEDIRSASDAPSTVSRTRRSYINGWLVDNQDIDSGAREVSTQTGSRTMVDSSTITLTATLEASSLTEENMLTLARRPLTHAMSSSNTKQKAVKEKEAAGALERPKVFSDQYVQADLPDVRINNLYLKLRDREKLISELQGQLQNSVERESAQKKKTDRAQSLYQKEKENSRSLETRLSNPPSSSVSDSSASTTRMLQQSHLQNATTSTLKSPDSPHKGNDWKEQVLRDRISELENEIQVLSGLAEKLQEEHRNVLEEASAEEKNLRLQLDAVCAEHATILSEYSNTVDALEIKLSREEQLARNLQTNLEKSESRNQDLEAAIQLCEGELRKAEATLEAVMKEKDESERKAAGTVAEQSRSLREKDALLKTKTEKIAGLQSRITHLSQDLEDAQQKLSTASLALWSLRKEKVPVPSQQQQLMSSAAATVQTGGGPISRHMGSSNTGCRMDTSLDSSSIGAAGAHANVVETERLRVLYRESQDRVQSLQHRLNVKEKQVATLQQELSHTESALTSRKHEVEHRQKTAQRQEQYVEDLRCKIKSLESAVADAKQELGESEKMTITLANELQKILQDAETERTAFREAVAKEKEERSKLQGLVQGLSDKVQLFEAEKQKEDEEREREKKVAGRRKSGTVTLGRPAMKF
eukprot:ANDGO_03575.mRNA.1 hypothetical protein